MTRMPLVRACRSATIGMAFLLATGPEPLGAQERLTLASAQVVTLAEGPPLLRLAANGALAFDVEPTPGDETSISVTLHGVARSNLDGQPLVPFQVSVRTVEAGLVLTVTAAGEGGRPVVRAGRLAHEIEVVLTPP